MLRIHFSGDDATRIRVAPAAPALWDVACSLHLLGARDLPASFEPWRRTVRRHLHRAGLARAVRALASAFPVDGRPAPSAAGGGARELVRRYHEIAVAPFARQIAAAVAADRAVRARAALDRGVEGLMASYRPHGVRWCGGVLHVRCAVDADVHVRGRPLTLLPSFFGTRTAVLADPLLPPVLAYPLLPAASWLTAPPAAPGGPPGLRRFLGPGRCAVLAALRSPLSTRQLADALHLSPSAASRRAAALREAGLLSTARDGRCVRHALRRAGSCSTGWAEPGADAPIDRQALRLG
ncbi:ArsR family transcriptional regulator [Kitasatospora sp. NPDC059646]|uniref:ArsR family transcriptional regulator n=1 Tax=Kitasatospora sp. NPDC059646 TaxID=3346893 RepID=UPI0036A81722